MSIKIRGWVGSYICRFYHAVESINHLFSEWHSILCEELLMLLCVMLLGHATLVVLWWIAKILPLATNLYVVGVAALYMLGSLENT